MKRIISLFLLVIVAGLIPLAPLAAQSGDAPQVRAVLFWRETCGHCHYVITEVFPPLQAQYGDQLEIVMIELGSEPAARRFYAAGEAMGLAPETMGVPLMIIGDHLLIGSQQIPQELPGLIDSYLAAGGVDIPAIAGLEDLALPAAEPVPAESVTGDTLGWEAPPAETNVQGISGSIPAFLLLVTMPVALIIVGVLLSMARRGRATPPRSQWVSWAIPALSLAGLGVAGYLAYVEIQLVDAVCGPIGDCNAVQSSVYARLFGIPIGLIGVIGYLILIGVWVWGRSGSTTARALLLGMTVFGVVVSIYLTYLELFVIEAVCLWCLSSAVLMTLIMLAAAAWLARGLPRHPAPPARPRRPNALVN
ncbi:MAG: vitamin K epoxide reductase family protein [Anaerolineae bacterium]|uniref:vitamin K epoxide reductase family protein n=1 Tax=Promineifilum sp. TaxID=2664178 RepID=UPI001D6ACE75|nr:vitamin K epoxide reductase family protein [Anaerolineales bacterium]MCO5181221.1 vitamin K epoxide reductase family protein [Promineifilum sp.]MCW5847973.1 vitamin K epoxide reductase family protein [Anaerolineae bacterium]